jgi:hypothetical protein
MDVLIKLRIEMSVMNYKPHRYANVMEFRYWSLARKSTKDTDNFLSRY